MSESTISLYRPRRRVRFVVAASVILVAAGIAVAAVLLPNWVRYQDNGLPRVVGADAIAPIVTAQAAFLGEHGRYAASLDELENDDAAGYRWKPDLMLRIETNPAGDAYLAGAVGFTGDYAAAVIADGTDWRGSGATFEEALRDAGWTERWAIEHGFEALAATDHTYGQIAVRDGQLVELQLEKVMQSYSVTIRPVPTAGSGTTWQEAVTAAGGDPADFPVDAVDTRPLTVTSEAGDTLMLVAAADGIEALLSPAGEVSGPFGDGATAAAAAGAGDLLDEPNGSYRCATASAETGIHSVTLCQNISGAVTVWATTGKASTNPIIENAYAEVGATTAWARAHGITLPDLSDLL